MSKRKHVDERNYVQIKALLNAGVRPVNIVRSGVTTHSANTVNTIKKSSSFENYKELVRARNQKNIKAVVNGHEENDTTYQLVSRLASVMERFEERLSRLEKRGKELAF